MDDNPDRGILSEEKASLVLERATQIEAQGAGEVGIDDLRRAALDAGIKPAAFERALAEVQSTSAAPVVETPRASPTAPQDPLPSGLGAVARAGVLGIMGSTLAGFAYLLDGVFEIGMEPAGIFSLILAAFLVVGLAVDAVKKRGVRDFMADLAPFWAGLTMIFMIGAGADADEVLGVMAAAGIFTSGIGSGIVALAGAWHGRSLPSGDQPPALESPGDP